MLYLIRHLGMSADLSMPEILKMHTSFSWKTVLCSSPRPRPTSPESLYSDTETESIDSIYPHYFIRDEDAGHSAGRDITPAEYVPKTLAGAQRRGEALELDRWIDGGGFVDTFRHFEPGEGHYSWWSQRLGARERNVGWRIDYVLPEVGYPHYALILAAKHLYAGSVVAGMADRVHVMYAGRLVETGPTDDLFATSRHPYTHGLMGSIPKLHQDVERLTQIQGSMPRLTEIPTGNMTLFVEAADIHGKLQNPAPCQRA